MIQVILLTFPADAIDWARLTRPPEEYAGKAEGRSPLLFDDGSPVRDKEGWGKRRAEILRYWHEVMGPWPELLKAPRVEKLGKERDGAITRHAVRIEVAPGKSTEDAYLLIPDGKGPFPAVVAVFYDAKSSVGLGKSESVAFARMLAAKGLVTLALGSPPETYYPDQKRCKLQPLSFHAYVAANCHTALSRMPEVDARRIGIVGHSYGGKWAMFAACLHDRFACAAWSDPGIVFDEKRSNVNYWERWYLGFEPGKEGRKPGIPSEKNPRTGAYRKLIEDGRGLHELHALMAPRPFLVSAGSEDPPSRWLALNHSVAVNTLLGTKGRVAMHNRPGHAPTAESNAVLVEFFQKWLGKPGVIP
jgi:hypothetical protein